MKEPREAETVSDDIVCEHKDSLHVPNYLAQ